MKKLLLLCLLAAPHLISVHAQTASTFIETTSNGCSGLALDDDFLYVVSSFDGKVFRKNITSTTADYESFTTGASGYQGICKVGNFVYVSKPFNGVYGIYRFNPDATTVNFESFMSLNSVFGLAHRNSELYLSGSDKIYKIDVSASAPALVQIADNIAGTSGFNGSTMGLKVYDGFLYVSESTGISKINLDSGNYEKESITTYTGSSFAKGGDTTFYLTSNNGVYELDTATQTYSLLLEIEDFIGTFDIVFANNSLFVTTQEGDFNKVARIDLETLGTVKAEVQKALIFPNPATDFINVQGLGFAEDVSIINQRGQIVKSVKIGKNKIDISDLQAGIYFVKSNNVYSKFIKE
jgi:hypothetical protein